LLFKSPLFISFLRSSPSRRLIRRTEVLPLTNRCAAPVPPVQKVPGQSWFRQSPFWTVARPQRFFRLFDEFFGAEQCGSVSGCRRMRKAGMLRSMFFGMLDFFPVRPDFIHVFDFCFAEDMRMAARTSFSQSTGRLFRSRTSRVHSPAGNGKRLAGANHQFLGHFVVVAGFDGVNQFIDLLDGVAAQCQVTLLAVPRTAARQRSRPWTFTNH